MRIGKVIKTVTSPKRTVRKFNEKSPAPIPVKLPEKKPVEAIGYRYTGLGISPFVPVPIACYACS